MTRCAVVVGLDCASPRLIFGPEAPNLPNLRRLMGAGVWGLLRSCDPPITIPAWSCMMSGLDPGTLGCYGFQYHDERGYGPGRLSTSDTIRAPRVWDRLSTAGKRVCVLGVPQTYPPYPVNGVMVSGLLTPDSSAEFTHPTELKAELTHNAGDYIIDAENFRTNDKDALLDRIRALMNNRFDVAEYLLSRERWDFFMMVDMSIDRLHHAFWRYWDADHPQFDGGRRYAESVPRHYEEVDARIGRLLDRIDDDTTVFVVSDHGARALHGGFCINQWLVERGYLVLKDGPSSPSPLRPEMVDWPRTMAWAAGGYCARIMLNVRGREPEGRVDPSEFTAIRNQLAVELCEVNGPSDQIIRSQIITPGETYREVRGIAPDLIAYIGDLSWRAVGQVGMPGLFTATNDSGPDDANHDFDGVFIASGGPVRSRGEAAGISIYDVAPTLLDILGEPDRTLPGRSLA